jgi:hypothetical protein
VAPVVAEKKGGNGGVENRRGSAGVAAPGERRGSAGPTGAGERRSSVGAKGGAGAQQPRRPSRAEG